jgi:uncharacterized protein
MVLSRRQLIFGGVVLGGGAALASRFMEDPTAVFVEAPAYAEPTPPFYQLINAGRRQIGVTTTYDPAYSVLQFPFGDVPRNKGVCTDVVIRAYRDAFRVDLQQLVNADMKKAFGVYPKRWGLKSPDRNIDHRRVPNLQTFLSRQGAKLPLPARESDWQPGDIFTSLVGGNLPHIGIVSDRKTTSGRPLAIHNIGSGTREEDVLYAHKLTGRYRWRV